MGYDFGYFDLTGSVNYSPEYFGESGDAFYTALASTVPLSFVDGLSLGLHVGHQTIDDDVAFGISDYTDWSVGLDYEYEGFTIGVHYMDTNVSKNECADGCDARFVGSISRSF